WGLLLRLLARPRGEHRVRDLLRHPDGGGAHPDGASPPGRARGARACEDSVPLAPQEERREHRCDGWRARDRPRHRRTSRRARHRMGPRGRGHIVNITSAGSYMPTPGEAMYSATKHAARAFTEAVRDEVRGTGIELTAVMPGLVRTELAAGTRAGRGSQWVEPEEVAEAVVAAMERPRPDV